MSAGQRTEPLIYGIEGFNLYCDDLEQLEETARFYTETLELPWYLPYEPGQDWAAIALGQATIWLAIRPDYFLPHAPEQPGQIAMAVVNLEEAIRELEGKVTWLSKTGRRVLPEGVYYRYRRLCDPAGNLLWIIECHENKSPNGPGGPDYLPHLIPRGPHDEED